MAKEERLIKNISQFGLFALAIWLIAGTTISSCQKSQNNPDTVTTTQNTQTTTQTTPPPAAYVTEYPVYRTSTEAELTRNQDTISAIKERLKNSDAKLRASLQREEEALARENADLRARLETYKDQGGESWQKFRSDFDHSMDSIRTALKNMQTKIYIEHD
jgi:Skp family chaperone for outer membrane proteins